ncbi:MAG: T9SS type A sorting domain-containing protein, partial [Candidatus Marinimicrobia bacterium]|nr:T9SS type A sorting domain-containing protein [Candidatus Neomarinimicrobiota bacterium]
PEDKIYDDNNIFVGWRPVDQFDLTAEEDSLHCIFEDSACYDVNRGHSIKGPDPNAPWFDLGSDTGLPKKNIDGKYYWVDTNVIDGLEYTYSVTAYDMGVEAPSRVFYYEDTTGTGEFYADTVQTSSNPNSWSEPDGYQFIENSRGTTIHDPNFVTVIPGFPAAQSLDNINVVPNPYIVRSGYNESEYIRKLLFSGLPQNSSVTIFTVTGEKVNSFTHTDATTGNEFWNLRSVNNQEVAPGLYIYVVEWEGKKHIGKFAVVR